ncbi:MAG: hypothetical protein KAI47_00695 [Deltaproteobacteria bacterium]|nr:hypothetical protein [Deltaproteobacteria bacterium]
MPQSDVDKLLESYLISNGGDPKPKSPTFPVASESSETSEASDDLDTLLARYLETTDDSPAGDPESPTFALPRKSDIDDLLKKHYRKDQHRENLPFEDTEALRRGLADHLAAVDSTRRAVGSTIDEDKGPQSPVWRKRTASDVHRQGRFDEKLARYAQALDDEDAVFEDDEDDEDLYAFDPTGSTIHGMPPGNAPRPTSDDKKK